MEFSEWLNQFAKIIKQRQPNSEERTFEDHLETFAELPPLLGKSVKCAHVAEILRQEGNELFKSGSYEDAAMWYTESIRKAPPYSKCAALAHANRSAASYHLKAYEECVLDIDKALDLPYPDDLRQKILSRKEAAVSNLNKVKSERKKPTPINNLKFAHGESAKLPGASTGIDIVYSPDAGRKLVAKVPFRTGDVLIVEKPFLMAVKMETDPLYCYHCFKKSLFLIPCDKCTYNVYCSEKCRTEAYENYHRIECPIQSAISRAFPSNTRFALEVLRCLNIFTEQGTNLHAVLKDHLEMKDCSDPAKLGFTGEQFIGSTRKAFLSSSYGRELSSDHGSFFGETYIAVLLRNYTDFFKNNADVKIVAKLLLSLKSAYSLNHLPIRQFGGADNIAHATFPLLHLARHACFNNTLAYHEADGTIVLRASRNIKPGEEISFNVMMWFIDFKEIIDKEGRFRTALCRCVQCDKSVVYPLEQYSPIKIDKKLSVKLRKNPFNIAGLWKLLHLTNQNYEPNDLPVQVAKMMLVDAYHGRCDPVAVGYKLRLFGIR